MRCLPQAPGALHGLRFVTEGSASVLRFVPHVTSADIARIWSGMADQRPDRPVAIGVTFAPVVEIGSDKAPVSMTWLPAHLGWGRDPVE